MATDQTSAQDNANTTQSGSAKRPPRAAKKTGSSRSATQATAAPSVSDMVFDSALAEAQRLIDHEGELEKKVEADKADYHKLAVARQLLANKAEERLTQITSNLDEHLKELEQHRALLGGAQTQPAPRQLDKASADNPPVPPADTKTTSDVPSTPAGRPFDKAKFDNDVAAGLPAELALKLQGFDGNDAPKESDDKSKAPAKVVKEPRAFTFTVPGVAKVVLNAAKGSPEAGNKRERKFA